MHNTERYQTNALVIGSGIAGCTAALTMAEAGLQVTLITAGDNLLSGNTRLAQGGIVYEASGAEDSPEGHDAKPLEKDILVAGWKHNYIKAVRHLSKKGPKIIKDTLIDKYSVPFEQTTTDFALTKEGGHSAPRILYCADHTGKNIMECLEAAVEASENITVLKQRTAIDLLTSVHHAGHLDFKYSLANHCVGAYVFNERLNRVETILSDFTVLATGGVGQIYLHTTNTSGSIGSGISMASRAGATILNAEYVQFHPTALFQPAGKAERRFLISEAVRGEGARLINNKGETFMHRYDDRKELAPRDIVTRAILDEMLLTNAPCVYLDAANHVKHNLSERFPTICHRCDELGIDITKDPIPVVPAAHYFCGGILVDTNGRSTLERMYAVGECSCTGVHGANRLASTSLMEGVVWGYNTAQDIIKRSNSRSSLSHKLVDSIPDWLNVGDEANEDQALIAQDWATIRNTMWNYVGITRSTDRLNRAFADLRNLTKNLQDFYKTTRICKPIIDLTHGSRTAYLITLAALRNKESKGCHYRIP
ncbi:MAG: L-aspartate oxidase [Desulfovibrio sp.]